jgi:POT family proton-dependent oligopeptide transporter
MHRTAPIEHPILTLSHPEQPLPLFRWSSLLRLRWRRQNAKHSTVLSTEALDAVDPWRSCRRVLLLVESLTGFALYMVAALLVLLLSETVGQAEALRRVSTFNALCNLGPLLGGWLADRWLGFRWSVTLGAILLCLGFSLWAQLPAGPLLVPMGVLVLGSALFRSNIVALYARVAGDASSKMEHGFRAMYVAFNVGASLAPSAAALLRARFGWQGPLAASAVTMAVVVLLLALVVPPLGQLESMRSDISRAATARYPAGQMTSESVPSSSIGIPLVLLVSALILWSICFGQADGTMLLWARDHTRRGVLGIEIPASVFATLPAILVFVMAPLAALLSRLSFTRTIPRKLLVGMLGTALSMALLAVAAHLSGGKPTSAAWLLGSFVLLGVGEVLVAPLLQLSLCLLAPPARHGIMVAVFFGALAAGYHLAGRVGAYWPTLPKALFFGGLACLALLGAGLAVLPSRWLPATPAQ